jgi:hypothetical protein
MPTGEYREYGFSSDASILASTPHSLPSSSLPVSIWAMSSRQDTTGTYILYQYTQDYVSGAYNILVCETALHYFF